MANVLYCLNHLIEDGSDVIIISEHWLWPLNLHQLQSIHSDHNGFGFADKRLNDLDKGGVCIIWKNSLQITLVTSISSDRFCIVQLQIQNFSANSDYAIYIISVYLPSSDYPMSKFVEYLV